MKKHLAIFTKEGVNQIFLGNKTIETRFSKKRIPPFGEVSVGDVVYIKPSGEDIVGQFVVKKVISIEGMTKEDFVELRSKYGPQISFGNQKLDNAYFKERAEDSFCTILFMEQVEQFLTSPIKPVKKDRRGWMVLEN